MAVRNSKTAVASAVALAVSSMLLAASLNAGVINNSNNTPGKLGACGATDADLTACVGAWDLGNVDVQLLRADGITEFGSFDPVTGAYSLMTYGDTFASLVSDGDNLGTIMARVTGKDWPVGEPTAIKAVVNDTGVQLGKPQNCLISTSYLGADNSDSGLDAYLDSASQEPVICSSGFQSHKRFKIAMQPATVDGVNEIGAEGKPIDLVFNVADDETLRAYQVFSKINNHTGKRLKGYKIVVGTGVGAAFQSADVLGIEDKLYLSIGIGEGASDGKEPVLDGSDLFEGDDGLATFSHGLFGAPDKHFPTNGFFDSRAAGFLVEQTCSAPPCDQFTTPFPGIDVPLSDTIQSTGVLPSNYVEAVPNFGDWLHAGLSPKGIFFDDDSDPTTDAVLMAWWDGANWRGNYDSGFAVVADSQINSWAADVRYSVGPIEDTVNLGINYIVKVGDGIPGGKITIRIIPVVGDQEQPTPWLESAPADGDLLPVSTSSDNGGGCTVGGDGRFDPTLPALAAAGLVFFGLRRFKAGK